jgi:hypothetical protein
MLVREDWFSDFVNDSKGLRASQILNDDDGKNASSIRIGLLIENSGQSRNEFAVYVPSVFQNAGYGPRGPLGRSLGQRDTRNWIGYRRQAGLSVTPNSNPAGMTFDATLKDEVLPL